MQDTPEVKKQFANEGAEVLRMSSRRVRQVHGVGNGQMGTVVKEAGIKASNRATLERPVHTSAIRPGSW